MAAISDGGNYALRKNMALGSDGGNVALTYHEEESKTVDQLYSDSVKELARLYEAGTLKDKVEIAGRLEMIGNEFSQNK
jgi:DUF971 family protein|tara:strand:+ start:302 stop:538 length:237 start_codon:yes stop_codon:yes gene_type:complete